MIESQATTPANRKHVKTPCNICIYLHILFEACNPWKSAWGTGNLSHELGKWFYQDSALLQPPLEAPHWAFQNVALQVVHSAVLCSQCDLRIICNCLSMDINGISMMWACHLNKHIKGTTVNGTSLLYIFAQKKNKWSFLKPQTMEVPLLCVSLWVGGHGEPVRILRPLAPCKGSSS